MTRTARTRRAGLLAVVGCALAACGSASGASVPAPSPNLGTAITRTIPPAIARLPLTKPDGSTTTLAAYRGKAVMIADYLTTCTDICPMITANTVAIGRALAADGQQGRVALLEITVDPKRDTPARMRAYAKLYKAAPPDWTQLRASPADTQRLWDFFGVHYQREKEGNPPDIDWWTHQPLRYDVGHTDAVIFLDEQGRERFVVNANPDAQGASLPPTLSKSLSGQGRRNLRHPQPFDWTVRQGVGVFAWLLDHELAVPTAA